MASCVRTQPFGCAVVPEVEHEPRVVRHHVAGRARDVLVGDARRERVDFRAAPRPGRLPLAEQHDVAERGAWGHGPSL